jgi:hypothetical protein
MGKRNNWRYGYTLTDFLEQPRKIRKDVLRKVELQVHRVIMEHSDIMSKCPHVVWFERHRKDCQYFIKAPIFRNCSLVANHFGPFTVTEIASMMSETKDAVYHTQRSAMKKLRSTIEKTRKEFD